VHCMKRSKTVRAEGYWQNLHRIKTGTGHVCCNGRLEGLCSGCGASISQGGVSEQQAGMMWSSNAIISYSQYEVVHGIASATSSPASLAGAVL
jgi:hypothetical protein